MTPEEQVEAGVTECECDDKAGPGHDTGPIAYFYKVRGTDDYEIESCLNEAVSSGFSSSYHSEELSAPHLFVRLGGEIVTPGSLVPVIAHWDRLNEERERQRDEERKSKPRHRIIAEHPEHGKIDLGVDGSGPDWWKKQLEPFGFTVTSKKIPGPNP